MKIGCMKEEVRQSRHVAFICSGVAILAFVGLTSTSNIAHAQQANALQCGVNEISKTEDFTTAGVGAVRSTAASRAKAACEAKNTAALGLVNGAGGGACPAECPRKSATPVVDNSTCTPGVDTVAPNHDPNSPGSKRWIETCMESLFGISNGSTPQQRKEARKKCNDYLSSGNEHLMEYIGHTEISKSVSCMPVHRIIIGQAKAALPNTTIATVSGQQTHTLANFEGTREENSTSLETLNEFIASDPTLDGIAEQIVVIENY